MNHLGDPAAGNRYPVAVERFAIEPGSEPLAALRAAAGKPDESAEQALAFLTETLEAGTGMLDRRAWALTG